VISGNIFRKGGAGLKIHTWVECSTAEANKYSVFNFRVKVKVKN
jgi:hypothetical protein